MSRRMAPWTARVFQMLEHGPLPYSRVINDAASLVPPGRGYRHGIVLRASARKTSGLAPRSEAELTRGGKDDAIRLGQRNIVNAAVSGLKRRGRLVVYDDDGVRMLALGVATDTVTSMPVE